MPQTVCLNLSQYSVHVDRGNKNIKRRTPSKIGYYHARTSKTNQSFNISCGGSRLEVRVPRIHQTSRLVPPKPNSLCERFLATDPITEKARRSFLLNADGVFASAAWRATFDGRRSTDLLAAPGTRRVTVGRPTAQLLKELNACDISRAECQRRNNRPLGS